MDGVIRTQVGYAGGTKKNPTYSDLGDHTETLRIEFDPGVIGYEQILEVFFASHGCTAPAWSTQYRSVIFTHGSAQKKLAKKVRAAVSEKLGKEVKTAIESAGPFTPAEDYHQKHGLQKYGALMSELSLAYPAFEDLVASTAAARINGYVSGYGTAEDLEKDLPLLGLSVEASALLEKLVKGG